MGDPKASVWYLSFQRGFDLYTCYYVADVKKGCTAFEAWQANASALDNMPFHRVTCRPIVPFPAPFSYQQSYARYMRVKQCQDRVNRVLDGIMMSTFCTLLITHQSRVAWSGRVKKMIDTWATTYYESLQKVKLSSMRPSPK
jgi:hypothetical protein